MPEPTANRSKVLYWVAILAVTAILVYFIGQKLFPDMVQAVAGLIAGCLAVVTGLFFKKRRS
ncbi:MAG: hypothetical protein IPL65_19055 [Lewinellaceae bacterium]|nr:hypothetical protein [Lewinellaceae bacterium]